jgi:hypothetical protein
MWGSGVPGTRKRSTTVETDSAARKAPTNAAPRCLPARRQPHTGEMPPRSYDLGIHGGVKASISNVDLSINACASDRG